MPDQPGLISADFPVAWDPNAPSPVVLSDGTKTYLVFTVYAGNVDWDARGQELLAGTLEPQHDYRCIVTIPGRNIRFGGPNEEVRHGHPLAGRGIVADTVQVVPDSQWIAELRSMNTRHARFNPARWDAMKHFVFWFRDDTFECVAASLELEVTSDPLQVVLARLTAGIHG